MIWDHVILEKWFPLQGERAHSLKFLKTPISIQIKSKSNPNPIHYIFCTSFILCFQGQPELCGSYHLHQSCFAFSVSMTNLSRLVAVSFSCLALLSSSVSMANLSCLLRLPSPVLGCSPSHCRHLASIFWGWAGAVTCGFLFSFFRVLSSAFLSLL